MALQNDPRAFTGGYERVDTRPHVALYAQLMQRKQARDEAYDEYMRNLNKSINPAGLRNVDRPVFEQKLKEWQQYGIQNRDALRNSRKDQGLASMEFQGRYQDLINLVNESKQEEEKKKPLVEIMTDPAKRDRVSEEVIFPRIASHDKPLYTQDESGAYVRDPERRSFNVADIDFNPKPFEQDKYFKSFDDVKPSQKSQAVVKLPGFKEEITTTSTLSPQDKEAVATRAVAEYMANPSFKEVVDQLDPKEYNDLYKQEFGQDIQNPAQLASAYTLQGLQQRGVSKEIKDDTYAQRRALAELNDANARGRMYMKRAWGKADKATQDTWVDDQIAGIVSKGKKGGEVVYTDENGNKRLGFNLPLDPNMAAGLTRDKEQPDALRLNSDGTYTPIFLKRDAKGKAERGSDGAYEINKTKSVPLTYEQIKAAYSKQFGVKQANMEMGGMSDGGDESSYGSEAIGILD
jgi:hypothetical protein